MSILTHPIRIFLGGTCNDSQWRERLIPQLAAGLEAYNPVVPDWTSECQAEEIRQRESCDFCVYAITPLMTGVYSIAEAVDDSNKRPEKTLFCVLESDTIQALDVVKYTFTKAQLKSLNATGELIERNGGRYFKSEAELIDFLNAQPARYAR